MKVFVRRTQEVEIEIKADNKIEADSAIRRFSRTDEAQALFNRGAVVYEWSDRPRLIFYCATNPWTD